MHQEQSNSPRLLPLWHHLLTVHTHKAQTTGTHTESEQPHTLIHVNNVTTHTYSIITVIIISSSSSMPSKALPHQSGALTMRPHST